MNLPAVLEELAARLDRIEGLRVYAYPPDRIMPPAGFLRLPETIDYDATYGRGHDALTVVAVILVGKVDARTSHTLMARYANGSGAGSVKQQAQGPAVTEGVMDVVRVRSADFGVTRESGVDYLAGMFNIDIAGSVTP